MLTSSNSAFQIQCAKQTLSLARPAIMGVINVTPDSFYAPSRQMLPEVVRATALAMVNDGASIIDLGAEATSPQVSARLTEQEELDRLLPVLELLVTELDVPISIDTSKPEVMQAAIAAGASMINDVRALRLPGALELLAQLQVPVCLMHMGYLDTATAPTANSSTDNSILSDVLTFLKQRVNACLDAGIKHENIIIDPGFGNGSFGKSTPQNLYLLKNLQQFTELELPILVGLSRKTFVGETLDLPFAERLSGSLALTAMAVERGANIIRAHDVKETAQVVNMVCAVMEDMRVGNQA